MRVFYCGFNLYGQFINESNLVVEGFIDSTYDCVTNLELSHSCSVIVNDDGDIFLHGRKSEKTHQIQKIELPDNLNVIQITCSDDKILFLTANSLIFKLDLNVNEGHRLAPKLLPKGIFSNNSLEKIASGGKINVALSKTGDIFTFANKLNFKNRNITYILAGREHCIILDDKGNVYTFGRGSRGQLGHGNLDDELEPKLVEALSGIKIIRIAAGGWHSCAISAEGDLYVWGWNGNGQLGIGKPNEEAVAVMGLPQVIDFPHDLNVVDAACGNRHTVVLLENGHLFGAGWNKYHQLGQLEDCPDVNKMTFLYDFSNFNITSIKCGPWSTAVLCS